MSDLIIPPEELREWRGIYGEGTEYAEPWTMQRAYQEAAEEWITAIREEERLASVDPIVVKVDDWEKAHFKEEGARAKAKQAKNDYEDAISESLFGF